MCLHIFSGSLRWIVIWIDLGEYLSLSYFEGMDVTKAKSSGLPESLSRPS